MLAADINMLKCAADANCQFHAPYREWLDRQHQRPDAWYITWVIRSATAALLAAVAPAAPARADNLTITIAIDAATGRHAISPLIYGVAFGAPADLTQLGVPLNRSGGNSESMYNWLLNATNLGQDWYFESYPSTSAAPGGDGDTFIRQSKSAGAAPMLTIPMIGWVAKLGPNRAILPSFSVAKYGAQCQVDPYLADAGDGIHTDCSTDIVDNNPDDANQPDTPAAEQAWVKHLVATWGGAAKGGLRHYIMDNEPSIWFSTHRDVHPVGPHATEIRDKVIHTSRAVKAIDSAAKVVAPEEWGWEGYLYSGYDQQYAAQHGYSYYPDRTTEQNGVDYIPWLLKSWKAAGHPVDVLSVHFYPQGGEYSEDTSTAMQLLRNRSTRQLWDPTYVSESWINAVVELIPRLQGWVHDFYYAGTPVAVTEYNWGAENAINGATAQADILGIFGRYGLNMATRWTVPAATTPTYKAMQIYRNYDGRHSAFGDTAITAVVPNPDNLSAFAAIRSSDGAMTVMVINKVLTGATPVTLKLANFAASGTAQVYRLTAANVIARLPNRAWSNGKLGDTEPPQSITLYVLPK
ncbi:MAG: glycoside hydrolase family 44 protein [Xanthobacteraceae bacterium]|nr:glycoside hydrolase family 44 protein [Xanthobacteraceae bacterium]